MKYKHSREKINSFLENLLTHHINLKDNNWVKYSERLFDIRRDLLAQKEDKKECKHNWKLTPDTWGETCFYCGKQRKIKTTPSPLEIEEITEIKIQFFSKENELEALSYLLNEATGKINCLIRNQNLIIKQLKQNG